MNSTYSNKASTSPTFMGTHTNSQYLENIIHGIIKLSKDI